MFGKAELEALRLRKELLVLRSDMDRVRLVSELRRLQSAEYWLAETARIARRHPVVTALLGGGAGLLAVQSLRRPVGVTGWLGRLGSLGSVALSLWKLYESRQRKE